MGTRLLDLRFANLTVVIGRLDPAPVFETANVLGLSHVHHPEFGRDGHYSDVESAVDQLERDREEGGRHLIFTQRSEVLNGLWLAQPTFGETHTFIVCRANQQPEADAWRNLNQAEVDDFFRSLAVGVQHVGEILRTKGLW